MTNELKHAFEKKQKPRRRNALKNGWTDARRERQRAIIRTIKPWTRSTGPASSRGKAKSSQNAVKHGFRGAAWTEFLRALARQRLDVRLYLAHRAALRDGADNAFASFSSLYGESCSRKDEGGNAFDISTLIRIKQPRRPERTAGHYEGPKSTGYPACFSRMNKRFDISGARHPSSSGRPSYFYSAWHRSSLVVPGSWRVSSCCAHANADKGKDVPHAKT